ncbi:MAG TPA: leucyl aminopeptidase [Dehalococcoidia bacterium]|nr:leucyl aminopeptidase [Dehalococcoidia bacterium]
MEIKVIAGDVIHVETGAVVIGCFKEEKRLGGESAAIDEALDGAISRLISQGEVKGKPGEVTIIHSLGRIPAARVVVVGLGKKDELKLDGVRSAVAEACRHLQRKDVTDVAVDAIGKDVPGITAEVYAQAVAEGALLGVYTFRRHITGENNKGELKKLTIISKSKEEITSLEKGVEKGRIIAEAANMARDMVNEPSNYMTPTDMTGVAKKVAEDYNIDLTILEKNEMQKLGMGALLGVAQGSCQPPKFIVLNYKGGGSDGIDLALVGKGVTFDSGGISIKPSAKMDEMKDDMSGGAAVIAAISAIAQLKPKINVISIVPAVENLPSGTAIKPGDILTAITGKTIEIISTDAEGRLILADALGYVNKMKPKAIVDVATLTGACIVALGNICTGAFSNNQRLVDGVIAAGAEAGELIWQMPMYDEYKEQNKSNVADIKNVGDKGAGSITAAQFLAEFVDDTPWVHLDIAGTSFVDKERKYTVKGATGVPVRTLVNLAVALAEK